MGKMASNGNASHCNAGWLEHVKYAWSELVLARLTGHPPSYLLQ